MCKAFHKVTRLEWKFVEGSIFVFNIVKEGSATVKGVAQQWPLLLKVAVCSA